MQTSDGIIRCAVLKSISSVMLNVFRNLSETFPLFLEVNARAIFNLIFSSVRISVFVTADIHSSKWTLVEVSSMLRLFKDLGRLVRCSGHSECCAGAKDWATFLVHFYSVCCLLSVCYYLSFGANGFDSAQWKSANPKKPACDCWSHCDTNYSLSISDLHMGCTRKWESISFRSSFQHWMDKEVPTESVCTNYFVFGVNDSAIWNSAKSKSIAWGFI